MCRRIQNSTHRKIGTFSALFNTKTKIMFVIKNYKRVSDISRRLNANIFCYNSNIIIKGILMGHMSDQLLRIWFNSAFLKMWSGDPRGSPKPFQGVPEVKSISKIMLINYPFYIVSCVYKFF